MTEEWRMVSLTWIVVGGDRDDRGLVPGCQPTEQTD